MHTLPLLFNDVDGYEVLVIILVVLIFFGPKSIPGIAKTLGRALFSIRNASEELKSEIRKSGVDIKKDLNINEILKQQEEQILQPMDQEGTKVKTIIEQNQEPVSTLPLAEEEEPTEPTKPNQDKIPSDEV
jgi:sec-independent protein translocase protein TatA